MIEQRAVAVRRRAQLRRGTCANSVDVVGVELGELARCFSGRCRGATRVVRLGDAELRDRSRWLSSRAIMNVNTRVRSAWYASASRSNISADVLLERLGHADRRVERRSTSVLLCASARWMRRSISRTLSRYSSSRVRSRAPSPRCRSLASSATESRMLRFVSHARERAAPAVPARPNIRSNTTRGLISIGSGVVGDAPRDRVHVGAAVARRRSRRRSR